jgi:O-antigen ligase
LFDKIVSNYEARGNEETGRGIMWPIIVGRILESPIVGVGGYRIMTFIPDQKDPIPPHNSFLFFALSDGIVPAALYVAFWIGAARRSFSDIGRSEYTPFRLPLLLYVLVAFILADVSVEAWALLALTVGAGPAISHGSERLLVTTSTIRRRRIAPMVQLPSKARTVQQ